MDLKTRYVIKGIGKEQTIASKVMIFYDKSSGKITKVQDKWNGKLPESSFTNVSVDQLLSLWWWVHYSESWGWWVWSFTWEMRWWQVRALVYWSLGVMLGGQCSRLRFLWIDIMLSWYYYESFR
jgi:hypothetical protein